MKKVGIFSGTFDPVHEGHLTFAREAMTQCELDKVFFLVEPRPRRKQGVKAFEHRNAMVRIAIRHDAVLGSIVLEQQRFTAAETLPVLKQRFRGAELHMLMGDDWLSHFADWPHVEDLVRDVWFVVGLRRYDRQEVEHRLGTIQRTRGLAMRYQLFRPSHTEFSSQAIRRSLRQGDHPAGLPPGVPEYIAQHGLYTPSSGSSPVISS